MSIAVDDPRMPAGHKKLIPKDEFFDGIRKRMIMTQSILASNEKNKEIKDAMHKARHDAVSQQISMLNKELQKVDAEAKEEREKLKLYGERLKEEAWREVAPLVREIRLAEIRRRLDGKECRIWYADKIIVTESVRKYKENGYDYEYEAVEKEHPIKTLYVDPLNVMALYEDFGDSGKPTNKVSYNIHAVYLVKKETQELINNGFFRVRDDRTDTEYTTMLIHNRDFKTQEEAEKYAERNRGRFVDVIKPKLEQFGRDVMNAKPMDEVFDFRLLFHQTINPRYSTRENSYKITEVSSDRVTMQRIEYDRWDDKVDEYRDILYPEMIEVTRQTGGFTFMVKGAVNSYHVKEIGERFNDYFGVQFDIVDAETGQDTKEDDPKND